VEDIETPPIVIVSEPLLQKDEIVNFASLSGTYVTVELTPSAATRPVAI